MRKETQKIVEVVGGYRFADESGLCGPTMKHKLSDHLGLTSDGYLVYIQNGKPNEVLFGNYAITHTSHAGNLFLAITKGGVAILIISPDNRDSHPTIRRYKFALGDKFISLKKEDNSLIVKTELSLYKIYPNGEVEKCRK